jgi:hypothetical protein
MNLPFFRLCEWADFVKAKCLMNAEVALVLQRKYEQLQQLSDDPVSQISQVFEKSLQYVKRFSRYQNPEAVKQVRDFMNLRYVSSPKSQCRLLYTNLHQLWLIPS